MYAKCRSMEEAWRLFNKMPLHNVVSCTAMIFGHMKCGQDQEALVLFQQMQQEGGRPSHITFIGVLNACASVAALDKGKRAHQQIIESGFELNVFVAGGNGTIQMQRECVEPYTGTFVGILNACASAGALEEGKHFHEQIVQRGFESNVFVGSNLVNMYAKCGSMEEAQRVSNKMPSLNVVSWNVMILAHMMWSRAGGIGTILANGTGSLIDMYAKCGSMEDAQRVFNEMPSRNVVSRSAMIQGFAMHGYEFMVTWRWENALQHRFLKCTLKILQAMCCYQTSTLLLASRILGGIFSSRERKGV
ncbi:unnamed protein product [Sphagnum jensenii]|uniref:Pentatricopeptide repeat-containing protein n=1 Tax=Sphagnum jensenii TaxID=128206 RepID=A0ABP0WKR7_9BRYO